MPQINETASTPTRQDSHPQISYGCQAQTRASSPSLSQQNERSRRYTFRNPEFTSVGRTRIDRARRPRYWVYRGTGGLRELWGYFSVRFPRATRRGYSRLRGTPAWHLRRNSPRVGKPSRELAGNRPGEGY